MNDSCGDIGLTANNLWAMLCYRFEAMDDIGAIIDTFKFLKDFSITGPQSLVPLTRLAGT